jgi:CheY-like chemotaxis protein
VLPRILYCDDKRKWLEVFKQNHGGEYRVTTVDRGESFQPTMEGMLERGEIPDLILIDLFHPRHQPLEQERRNPQGNAAIERLKVAIDEARRPIEDTWAPYGLEMLKQARRILRDRKLDEVPIVIYTEQGLAIAKDEELKLVAELGGQWLLKGRDQTYETMRLREIIARGRGRLDTYVRANKIVSWSLALLCFLGPAAFSYLSHKTVDWLISLGASALVALIPVLVPRLERRMQN